MTIPFTKLQGAGNDYIAIDGRGLSRDWNSLAIRMSLQSFGVGSDGIVLVQESSEAQIRMRVFNPDGSEAEMSGNGIRLFAKFVIDNGIVVPGDQGLIVETGGGIRTVVPRMEDGKMVTARVTMGEPEFEPAKIPVDSAAMGQPERVLDYPLKVAGTDLKITCLSIGNPHAVAFLEEPVEEFPLVDIGPLVENHRLFPNRINFEIANVIDRNNLRARIFERGAGETLSSGSGTTAVAVAARLHGFTDDAVDVRVPGGILHLEWPGSGEVYLEGPAVEVFTGEWPD